MFKLAGLFLITAILYAAVGFGGGSTYNALLVLSGTDFHILPAIALICNIIVVFGGTIRFHRLRLIPWGKVWPLFALSVPLAWIGGRISGPEHVFVLLLGLSLFAAGSLMLIQTRKFTDPDAEKSLGLAIPMTGAALGLLSGMVGIGGGIFLAPVLNLMRWGRAKVIAGVCSAFILVNSLAGLSGQMMKLGNDVSSLSQLGNYWPLFIAVLIGGQIGSRASSSWLNPKVIRLLTALLILFVSIRLLLRSAQAFWVI